MATLRKLALCLMVAVSSARVMFLSADSTYSWSVTQWIAGCSENSSDCSYAFDISGAYHSSKAGATPAFAAHCSGSEVGAAYKLCANNNSTSTNSTKGQWVAAKLLSTNETTANLAVSYEYDDLQTEGEWWNYTAYAVPVYNQAEPTNFTMTPSELRAAA